MEAPFAGLVWGSRAPTRVKFFCGLLVQRRVNTRDVLVKKHILGAAGAGCPICAAAPEMADHLLFRCKFVKKIWRSIGAAASGACAYELHLLFDSLNGVVGPPNELILLCRWQLWKHRNTAVFQRLPHSLGRVLRCYREDAVLWRGRLHDQHRGHVDSWLRALSPRRA